jgi:hypothetical protein
MMQRGEMQLPVNKDGGKKLARSELITELGDVQLS